MIFTLSNQTYLQRTYFNACVTHLIEQNGFKILCRGVARGGAEGVRAPPGIWYISKTLFKPEGADYAPQTTASPPRFKKLSTSLLNSVVPKVFLIWKILGFNT